MGRPQKRDINWDNFPNEKRAHLIEALSQFVTAVRVQRMDEVIENRTRYLTLALEDVYQPHNAAAVVRTCEAFGVQDLYVIENRNNFKPSRSTVSRGADKWVDIHYSDNTTSCLESLKDKGYQIAACTLNQDAVPIDQLNVDKPTVVLIGTELKGLTQEAHKLADVNVYLPMQGFTQSLNLSVCAALFLYELTHKIRRKIPEWPLSPEEKQILKLRWLYKIAGHNYPLDFEQS
ncbi:MAG: rRNA methyltransferase [Verrucomicrobia bacterium CG_4_10_14_3_um_filter_43_23]|nr:MAG: hypothetical protein AUJ82_08405 [Verrucomicrobia bacterium CG1_02_43_26]PIP59908.1 MAG: rRNA methyltransferase [Verrucomicrobia bacterium CG22_combo_CG10-13_8_21_14_all_43_17]PIX58248.1 MAG: rRNA methyltransferase [Verrucomicrobia bacterium CG_4_10_14_3_um_filter_43_23]PIY62434.1 MAG: rRNA methyltransferase [Verrucomicrobia bacterium CG_4_10_14_0_8_um_filter_43_34]PJA44440.1 MAG: rRNA methyltransferase [Verrucomicrobia bacterium CG_4_9_14_3_um_filter_43_20]